MKKGKKSHKKVKAALPAVTEVVVTAAPTPKVIKSKRERFLTLGSQRVEKAIKAMSLVAHCANKAAYEYTTEDVAKLTAALMTATRQTVEKFTASKAKGEPGFKF